MRSNSHWIYLFILVALFAPGVAFAQYGSCVETTSVSITCQGPGGCSSGFTLDTCRGSSSGGGYCNCGYGLCCGNHITSCNASGQCLQHSSSKPQSTAPRESQKLARRQRGGAPNQYMSLQMIFVPDRCAKSYGAVIPRGIVPEQKGDSYGGS